MSDAPLTIQDFEPHVGTGFVIHTNEHVETFTLTRVEASKHPGHNGREPFSLLFVGSSNDLMINSQLVLFKHEAMGDLAIMISPIGRNDDGTVRYEAVFN